MTSSAYELRAVCADVPMDRRNPSQSPLLLRKATPCTGRQVVQEVLFLLLHPSVLGRRQGRAPAPAVY